MVVSQLLIVVLSVVIRVTGVHGYFTCEWVGQASPAVQLDDAENAAIQLLHDPHDRAANGVVGGYLCFVKGDWSVGLPMLARSDDAEVAAAATAELARPAAIDERLALAARWRAIAESYPEPLDHQIRLHADELDRRTYPEMTGLPRWRMHNRLMSRPLLVFDADNPPRISWVEEQFRFWANHGREGPGSWANYGAVNARHVIDTSGSPRIFVANRAGYVETLESFPPEGATRYEIEAELWSDLLPGTAIEFGDQRVYFNGDEGISTESGWKPPIVHPISSEKYHHFVFAVEPGEIAITVDGRFLGTLESTSALARGPIVLRGWEGHVRCRRLAVWSLPE